MIIILKGNICFSKTPKHLETVENGYLICEDGVSKGVFRELPEKYAGIPVTDYGDNLIIPGLVDLHIHAPQYNFRALGMDLELLDWLNEHTFPEESNYAELEYAEKAYRYFVEDLKQGATTRASIYATIHVPATVRLMEMLEESGLVTLVGKINMDRNSPDILCEESAVKSIADTVYWVESVQGRFQNTSPILTPRFIPSCTDELMRELKSVQNSYQLPVQSHLSENQGEIAWVRELCPWAATYGGAYSGFGLLGGEGTPTIMAHCIWSEGEEERMLHDNGVYIAHCPNSNMNLSSGIAPIRRFMDHGMHIGLGSDVAGGCQTSIFRAMSDAIQVSKLHWRLVNQEDAPLTLEEAFYLGTLGGGSFFGKAGSFEEGYEFDAVVIDDHDIHTTRTLNLMERLARVVYLSDNSHIRAKYVRGNQIEC